MTEQEVVQAAIAVWVQEQIEQEHTARAAGHIDRDDQVRILRSRSTGDAVITWLGFKEWLMQQGLNETQADVEVADFQRQAEDGLL